MPPSSRHVRKRPDAALYVDEVHNYLTLPTPLEEMLAEARAYRLSLLCSANSVLTPRGCIRGGVRRGDLDARRGLALLSSPVAALAASDWAA